MYLLWTILLRNGQKPATAQRSLRSRRRWNTSWSGPGARGTDDEFILLNGLICGDCREHLQDFLEHREDLSKLICSMGNFGGRQDLTTHWPCKGLGSIIFAQLCFKANSGTNEKGPWSVGMQFADDSRHSHMTKQAMTERRTEEETIRNSQRWMDQLAEWCWM